ncbi:hypothetical protein DFJ74DRAFT_674183 [Hyaloraphidium curvatum]|nr:hypothetical protein DFJ74DRAFT_674183 [Hyaloraphidium curvatum]
MLSADAAGLVAAAGKGRTWWKLRLHAVLGKVVAYHWHCIKNSIDPLQNPELVSAMRQRVLALLEEHEQLQPIHLRPFSLLNPAPTAADVWSAIALRLAYISLHTPRKGSGLDPSVLLSSVTWLGSPDFPACAEHSSRVADLVAKLDAVDPLRDHMDFCLQVPAAQIAGTIAFVRMVVAQRAVALLLATGSRSDAVLARVEASAELARAHLRLLRRHQALTGRMSRMAAQMALFLRTMEEGSQQFGRILELAHTGVSAEARAPVIWTEQGLLITHESAGRVLVDWADAVGAEHEDEWASPAPKRSETIGGEVQSPASQSTAASDATASAVEWKWRLGGVPELERRLQMHAGPGSGP